MERATSELSAVTPVVGLGLPGSTPVARLVGTGSATGSSGVATTRAAVVVGIGCAELPGLAMTEFRRQRETF